jgi:hypothetical protein
MRKGRDNDRLLGRPEAKALGYLEAKTTATADSSAALRNDKRKEQPTTKQQQRQPTLFDETERMGHPGSSDCVGFV